MAAVYGYSDSLLSSIITITDEKHGELVKIYNDTQGVAGNYISAVKSSAGILMRNRLENWGAEFNQILSQLDNLNQQANALLQINKQVEAQAEGQH